MWISISLVVALILAFAMGITILRQSKAIWSMNSSNAITINNTLNTFTLIEPLFVIIIIVAVVCLWVCTRLGFG
jgi:hypothetical protein